MVNTAAGRCATTRTAHPNASGAAIFKVMVLGVWMALVKNMF